MKKIRWYEVVFNTPGAVDQEAYQKSIDDFFEENTPYFESVGFTTFESYKEEVLDRGRHFVDTPDNRNLYRVYFGVDTKNVEEAEEDNPMDLAKKVTRVFRSSNPLVKVLPKRKKMELNLSYEEVEE